MTDITSDCTFKYVIVGDLKMINIVTPATAITSDTIDLGSDSAAGKINTIMNTIAQDDAGADVTTTWAPATGIITLGSVTTGIHNITVVGL